MTQFFRSKYSTSFFTNIAIIGMATLNSVLLARWLGPTGRGEIAATLLWPALLIGFGSLGQFHAVTYFAAQDTCAIESVFTSSVVLAGGQSLVLLPLGYMLLPFLLSNQTHEVLTASRIYLSIIPLSFFTQYWMNLLRGKMRIVAYNVIQAIPPTLYLVGVIVLYLVGELTLLNIVLVNILHNALAFLVTCLFLKVYRFPIRWKFDRDLNRRMLSYGLQLHIGTLFRTANLRMDQALIAFWLDAKHLGLYVVAVSVTQMTGAIGNAVILVSVPAVARLSEKTAQVNQFMQVFRKYWSITFWVRFPIAAALPLVIPLIFGAEYRGAILVAEVLLVASLPYDAQTVLMGGAQAFGTPWLASRTELIAFFFTGILLVVLVPTLGIMGAAVTSLVAYSVAFGSLVYSLSKLGLFTPRSLLQFGPITAGRRM